MNRKLRLLDHLYKIYDDFASHLNISCKRYCAFCCTRNVTLTSLEAYQIIEYLISNGKSDLLDKMKQESAKERYQPAITTNRFAELCMLDLEIPEEESDVEWGECPFLQNNECPIYPVRPFGCRCFVSTQNCGEHGSAYVDPFVLTVNNLFLQYIEHIDVQGYFGNFTDILLFMASEENRQNYTNSILKDLGNGSKLIANQPIKILMIPPEHREQIKPIFEKLKFEN